MTIPLTLLEKINMKLGKKKVEIASEKLFKYQTKKAKLPLNDCSVENSNSEAFRRYN